jgi:hypothetical protein
MNPPFRDGHTQSVPPTSPNGNTHHGPIFQVGQIFIPRRVLSSGVIVPDSLLACRAISDGAKLLWARLARYAGTRGQCFPLLSTVAADLGRSERQVQRYLAELVAEQLGVARQRGFNKSNTTGLLSCNGNAKNGIEVQASRRTSWRSFQTPIDSACPLSSDGKTQPPAGSGECALPFPGILMMPRYRVAHCALWYGQRQCYVLRLGTGLRCAGCRCRRCDSTWGFSRLACVRSFCRPQR